MSQSFAKAFIENLAGSATLNAGLVNVLSGVLANQIEISSAGTVSFKPAFDILAKVFAFISTPAAERPFLGPIAGYSRTAFEQAKVATADEIGINLPDGSPTDEGTPQLSSSLLVRVADISTETPEAPLLNVELEIGFTWNGEDTSILARSADGTYEGLRSAIDTALTASGLSNLVVTLGDSYNEIMLAGNTTTLPFVAREILITDSSGNEFTGPILSTISINPVVGGFLVAGSVMPQAPSVVIDPPTAPEIDYTLAASTYRLDEGDTVTITVDASQLPETGAGIGYSITGVDAADLEQSLTGVLNFNGSQSASVSLTLSADRLTEGTETLVLTLDDSPGTNVSVLVNDTSLTYGFGGRTPVPTGDGAVVASDHIQQLFTSGYDSVYSYSQDYRKDALLGGSMWGYGPGEGVELTYSFPNAQSLWPQNYGSGEPFNQFMPLNTVQQQGVRDALNAWAEVANVRFTEVSGSNGTAGDLRFGFSGEVSGNTSGWAYSPNISNYYYTGNTLTNYDVSSESGDVWLNPQSYWDEGWQAGTSNYNTLLHEVGHALGLKHPFDTDGNGTLLSVSEDTDQYSVMSYTNYELGGDVYVDEGNYYSITPLEPSSPMFYDVLAIQYLYGPNWDTHTGNDVYTFNSDEPFLSTLWDAGGTDTLDVSNQPFGAVLNLNAGTFSSVGARYLSYGSASAAVDNLAIAFGVEIENAVGTLFDDIMIGNALNNVFTPNGGSDRIEGGAGVDTAVFSGNYSDYMVSGSVDSAQVASMLGTVQLVGVEQLLFSDTLLSLA